MNQDGLEVDEKLVYEQIAQHREQIDAIDVQLLALLNERAEVSLAIRALKDQIGLSLYVPQREAALIGALKEQNKGPLYDENLAEIFETILSVMRKL